MGAIIRRVSISRQMIDIKRYRRVEDRHEGMKVVRACHCEGLGQRRTHGHGGRIYGYVGVVFGVWCVWISFGVWIPHIPHIRAQGVINKNHSNPRLVALALGVGCGYVCTGFVLACLYGHYIFGLLLVQSWYT